MSDAEALALLTPRQRQVMVLAKRGHDADEISRRLNIGRKTVHVVMYTARRRIKSGGMPLYSERREELRARGDDVCQFGHAKVPGRSCIGCKRLAKEEHTRDEDNSRVARELAAGKRCRHPMRSGAPCSLLLPCADHEQ